MKSLETLRGNMKLPNPESTSSTTGSSYSKGGAIWNVSTNSYQPDAPDLFGLTSSITSNSGIDSSINQF
jgi:hypothetical protein